MYVVTSTGKKLTVDDSSIDYENDFICFQQNVGLYTDNTILKPIWLVQGQRTNKHGAISTNNELEFIAEKIYNHKPTTEELLWFLSANGLSRFDIVTITEGYELDME